LHYILTAIGSAQFFQQSAAAERSAHVTDSERNSPSPPPLCVCECVLASNEAAFAAIMRIICSSDASAENAVQFYNIKSAALYVGRSVCRHSPTLAQVSFVVGRCINVSTQLRERRRRCCCEQKLGTGKIIKPIVLSISM
jgi:hypothetical protein